MDEEMKKIIMENKKMKKQKDNAKLFLLGLLLVVTCFLSGCLGAYLVISYVPVVTENIVKNVSEVSITENSIAESVDKVYDAVVVVESFAKEQLYSTGTGFVYKTDGDKAYIMTNNHVVQGGEKVKVLFSDNTEVDAEVVGGETYSDIAVLSVSKDKIKKVAVLGDSGKLRVGDTLFTVGSPEGKDYAGTVTKGVLSGKDRLVAVSYSNSVSDYYMKVLQTDAAINPGNSGGPLVNINGEVIGITNMKLVDNSVEGMGFAIPIEDALNYAAIIETEGQVVRPYFGISMLDINNDSYYLWQAGIKIPTGVTSGVVVLSVEANSPAAKAGLKKGDIVIELGGEETASLAEFRYELYKHEVGEKVKVKYLRDGKEQSVEITLGTLQN